MPSTAAGYRPSLATIVLVGDFDLDAAEKSLRTTFTTAPTTPARTYIEPELHYPRGLHLESHSDTLIRTATLDLIFPHKTLPTRTLSELFTEKVQPHGTSLHGATAWISSVALSSQTAGILAVQATSPSPSKAVARPRSSATFARLSRH